MPVLPSGRYFIAASSANTVTLHGATLSLPATPCTAASSIVTVRRLVRVVVGLRVRAGDLPAACRCR